MTQRIFISLPVADVAASTAFYEAIGCTKNQAFSSDAAASMAWSDTITFNLLSHPVYRGISPKPPGDARATGGPLFALALDSREAVDAFAAAAIAAGGREVHGAEDEGFMYSRGVEDPDGHGVGPFWMDAAAAPAAPPEAALAD
ncbi:glyoxalase [Sphingomonas glacialis]|uniref:Glyoxalase n=1 Tax=Sphingomonas glacialis TaxID=658225 RepID=A0ABQ3LIX3_9SPHN|nr:VOC family protein [Sphingomonas glacialis]GHH15615.1 glyoxalase [Sphingomonas glacialis]